MCQHEARTIIYTAETCKFRNQILWPIC